MSAFGDAALLRIEGEVRKMRELIERTGDPRYHRGQHRSQGNLAPCCDPTPPPVVHAYECEGHGRYFEVVERDHRGNQTFLVTVDTEPEMRAVVGSRPLIVHSYDEWERASVQLMNDDDGLDPNDLDLCEECGHLHYVSERGTWIVCPLADEGCTCKGQDR